MKRLIDYFTKRYFERQTKPKGFDDLEYKFVDSDGRRYFVWKEILEMPLERKVKLDESQMELSRMMTGEEMLKFLDLQYKLIDECVNDPNKRGENLAALMMQNKEIRMRSELLFHREIFVSMIACITVREDEHADKFDAEIHSQKVEQFMKDTETGLAFFLSKSGLSKLIPYIDKLGDDLPTLLEREMKKLKELNGSRTFGQVFGNSETTGKDT